MVRFALALLFLCALAAMGCADPIQTTYPPNAPHLPATDTLPDAVSAEPANHGPELARFESLVPTHDLSVINADPRSQYLCEPNMRQRAKRLGAAVVVIHVDVLPNPKQFGELVADPQRERARCVGIAYAPAGTPGS